jgi:hypothetical protein
VVLFGLDPGRVPTYGVKDDIRRAKKLAEKGIRYVDAAPPVASGASSVATA